MKGALLKYDLKFVKVIHGTPFDEGSHLNRRVTSVWKMCPANLADGGHHGRGCREVDPLGAVTGVLIDWRAF
jgi:hypothetical protein